MEYGGTFELATEIGARVHEYADFVLPNPVDPVIAITPLLSAQKDGRVRCVECTAAGFLGQDDSIGDNNPTSVTISAAAKQAIADAGFAQFGYDRAFTTTGQIVIGEIMALNPNFRWMLYWQFGHARQYFPGAARQLDQDVSTLLDPHRCKDVNGVDFVAWLNPTTQQVTTYWANYTDSQGNVDTALIDAHIQLLVDAVEAATYKPSAFLIDHYESEATGHWPQAANAELDLLYDVRQPSVAYQSDPAQQALLTGQQTYFQQKMLDTFDDELLIIANGSGAWPGNDAAIQAVTHGWFAEGFGTGPWSWVDTPYENMEMLWAAYTTPSQFLTYGTRTMPLMATDLRADYAMDDVRAQLGRAASLIFDGWWKYRPLDPDDSINESDLDDATWDTLVSTLGTPTGSPTRDDTYGTLVKYSRVFTGGTVWAIIDMSKPTYVQILEAGIDDDVVPVISGVTSSGGTLLVSASCLTDAWAERRVRATAVVGGTVYDSGWQATFWQSLAGATLSAPVGQYNMEIRCKDAFGNATGWVSAGQATAAPDIGG